MTFRILVVDDSRTVRVHVERLLTQHDMDVVALASAQEAIELLMDPAESFDCVVSDLMMPGLDGNDLINTIREEPRLDSLPILILTSATETEHQLRNLDDGAADFVTKPFDHQVLVARVRNLAQMKQMRDQLEQQSRTDPLTKLANRRHATARLEHEIERSRRYGRPLSVALLDIDHFKRVNDTLGHQAGDDVLVHVADELRAATRASDLVARWGGEEFLIVFPETTLDDAAVIADRFRRQLADSAVRTAGQVVNVTVSGGVAQLEDGDTPDSLVHRADEGLYEAKEQGRNRLLEWRDGRLEVVVA